nr:DUF1772 domain-containing protein [Acidiferrobacterales bacterium]
GMFLCTAFLNVPLNNRLAKDAGEENEHFWDHYMGKWTRWNHVRAISSMIACGWGVYALSV